MLISYARHQFPPVVIRYAIWLYVRFAAIQGRALIRSNSSGKIKTSQPRGHCNRYKPPKAHGPPRSLRRHWACRPESVAGSAFDCA